MDLAVHRACAIGVTVGLHARGGPVDRPACLPRAASRRCLRCSRRCAPLLARLRGLRREAGVVANLCDNGADLLLRTDAALTADDRTLLIAFAREHGWRGSAGRSRKTSPEPVLILRPPEVALSGVAVQPPPGGFLQASAAGEAAIVEAVLAGLPSRLPARAPRIAELYAGCGTLSFALAQRVRVAAFEGDAAAADAAAARRPTPPGWPGGSRSASAISPASRCLPRNSRGVAAVVLDPPHAGAAAQSAQIAAAEPAARDLCQLQSGRPGAGRARAAAGADTGCCRPRRSTSSCGLPGWRACAPLPCNRA